MRTIAIAKRVILELLRDKRTLALMFIAPLLILTLMNYVFASNHVSSVDLGLVNVPSQVVKAVDKTPHVSIQEYTTNTEAKHALHAQKIDGIIRYHDNDYQVTHANQDAGKTQLTKAALQSALGQVKAEQFGHSAQTLAGKLSTLREHLPAALKAQLPTMQQPQATEVAIKNTYVYGDANTNYFDKMVPILMGFFVFFFVFLISGMALLRERTSGTLDRLLATPVRRSQIVFGYMLSYGLLAMLQTVLIVGFAVWILQVDVVGSLGLVFLVNICLAMVALAFGILMSTFANSEFQMMQFIPLIVIPQIFFSGLIPLNTMADWVQVVAKVLPMKYAGDALSQIVMAGVGFSSIVNDILVLLFFLLVLTGLNILGLKRYRKV